MFIGLKSIHGSPQVTKEDLVTLKNAGITHLRIPIGYWCVHAWKMHVNGDRWV